MPKTTRRTFLKTASLAGTGFFVAAGTRRALSQSPNEKFNVACIGVGGKGGSDSNNAAEFGNVIAICDVDRNTLENKGKADRFKRCREVHRLSRTAWPSTARTSRSRPISTPDHMHAPATLAAMRLGISCYTQKPLTRTIYEARLLAKVAKETGVCTQMGNQGTALDSSREAIAQLRSGVLGTLKEVYAWSNRPIWAQGPGRRMTMEKFAAQAKKENPEEAPSRSSRRRRRKSNVDWNGSTGRAGWASLRTREFWPGLYHSFQWRGWWDFGAGALGDMACHQLTVPFASCGLRDPISVVAKTSGHDYDSFPASSIIKFEFPETSERPAIPFWWYDRLGNKPPQEVFSKWGIDKVSDSGVMVVGEKGAFYSSDDYCGQVRIEGRREGHGRIRKGREQGQQRPEQHVRVVPGAGRRRSEDLPLELRRSGRPADRNDPVGQPGRLGRRQGWRRTAKWAIGARKSSGTRRT